MRNWLADTLPDRRALRVCVILLLSTSLAFGVSTIPGVRASPGFSIPLDGWLQGSAYALAGLVAILAARAEPDSSKVSDAIAAAVVLRGLAFVVLLAWIRHLDPVPYPSVADALCLSSSVALLLGLGVVLRIQARRLPLPLALDAVVGALAVTSVILALVYDSLVAGAGSDAPANVIVVNLAYPLIDVGMLVLVAGLLPAVGWRPTPRLAVLCAGVVGYAVVDAVYLFQLAAGTFRPGTLLQCLSLVATVAMALSARAPADFVGRQAKPVPGLVVPFGFALLCFAVLIVDPATSLPLASTLLACAALLVASVRTFVTMSAERHLSAAEISAQELELQRLRALVDGSSDFVAVAGLDEGVLYINPAGRRMVGLDPSVDVTGMTLADLLTEDGVASSETIERPAVIAHGHWEGESTLRDLRGGPPRPVAISRFQVRHPLSGEPWLVATINRDISERLAAERTRQALMQDVAQAQEHERARIADDVHDDSVQSMAAVGLRLHLLRKKLSHRAPDVLPVVDALLETVEGASERLRHLLFDLESPAERSDLASALVEAAAYIFEDALTCEVRADVGVAVDVPEATRVVAYRIAKEAMTNARKHAAADKVVVGLRMSGDGLEVTVSDDGGGIAQPLPVQQPGHLGMRAMHDRATLAGGWLRVEPGHTGGTLVTFWLPTAPTLSTR